MTIAVGSPVTADLADAAGDWAAAYIHIPFCARLCPYCDFAVVTGRDGSAQRYVAALRTEIGREPEWRPLDAVYVGGGTPSRLSPQQLGGILGDLRRRFGLNEAAEVSLEANPEDWDSSLAEGLRAAGFARVSFGAQSFDPTVLEALGRAHTPVQAATAVSVARRAGFQSINIDLIFGTPGETEASWRETVERALALGPDHLSLYALTVERGTELSRAIQAGAPAPDPDGQADAYEVAQELCRAAGLVHYEVSNWARPDHGCVYNLITWAQGEYLAFGTGAHGHRDGARKRNVRRFDAYLDWVEGGLSPQQGEEVLDRWGREQERLMIGLRRTAGVVPGEGGEALLRSPGGERLVEAGVLGLIDGRLAVLRPLLGDAVGRAVLALQPGER
jgi:putative oxygen-independent coproporphyrinogen III oxidase